MTTHTWRTAGHAYRATHTPSYGSWLVTELDIRTHALSRGWLQVHAPPDATAQDLRLKLGLDALSAPVP
jgi:hypothetical protein